jgi:hypothetical protein
MNLSSPLDPTAVWVFGKISPGWYMAKSVWDKAYAEHLQSIGYEVMRSVKNPGEAA